MQYVLITTNSWRGVLDNTHLLFNLFNYYCHFSITPSNGKTKIIAIAHVIKTKYDLWLITTNSWRGVLDNTLCDTISW
jgi:hypothetical protein